MVEEFIGEDAFGEERSAGGSRDGRHVTSGM